MFSQPRLFGLWLLLWSFWWTAGFICYCYNSFFIYKFCGNMELWNCGNARMWFCGIMEICRIWVCKSARINTYRFLCLFIFWQIGLFVERNWGRWEDFRWKPPVWSFYVFFLLYALPLVNDDIFKSFVTIRNIYI